ncbi:MAG TPA: AsmA family protein [Lichenihabitans sp.]|nr:AsmA family protein [Lichenihabitans sp.]
MRDSLTLLAILLVAVLTTALVAPYFIDWNSHRALIEARLSKAAGTRVSIAGPIDVKLLPQPVFRLGKVTIGGATAGAPSFTADEVDVSIAMTALMRGDVQVADATLRRPRLDLTSAAHGAAPFGLPEVRKPERFQFQHVAIVDGTFALDTPDHGRLTLTGLDLDAQATSLLGPFTATGSFGPEADRHPFRLATGTFESGRLRLKLGLDGAGGRPAVDVDGTLDTGQAQGANPKVKRTFEGSVTVAGALPIAGSPAIVPWRFAGHVVSDGATARLTDVELKAGADMRALDATGGGDASLTAPASVRLKLHGAQLDLDTLAVAPDKSTLAPPRGVDLLRRLDQDGSDGDPIAALAALPFGLALDFDLDTATAGPQTLLGLGGHIGIDGGKPIDLRLSAKGPDNAHLALDGRLATDPVAVFRGHLDMVSRDLPRLMRWMAPTLPEGSDWVRRMVPAQSMSFAGTVDLSATGMAARDLTLTLDRTTARGTLSYTAPVGGDPGRIFADLGSDALDLDALPDVENSPVDWGGLDLDLTLKARAITVVPTGIGPVDAGQVAFRLKKTGAQMRLDELSADIGSARVRASGTMDAGSAELDAHVDAPQLDAVAGALARLMPGRLTELLRARAPGLSPARLDLHLGATRGGDGGLLPTALTMAGTLNASRITAELKPEQPGDLDPATATVAASLDAESGDGIALMRQLGLPVAPGSIQPLGAGRFKGTAHGSAAAGFETTAAFEVGGATLGFKGRAKPELGSGRLSLAGPDLAPLLRAAGLAQPAPGLAWPADAEADLSWHDTSLSFHRLAGHLDGVGFTGDLTIDVAPPKPAAGQIPKPALFGGLAIDRLDASSLFGLAFGPTVAPKGGSAPAVKVAAPWPDAPFGHVVLHLPRTEIAVKIGTLGLRDGVDAHSASLTLRADRSTVTLADLTGAIGDGRLGATLTLRRDGASASLNGTVSSNGIALGGSGPTARLAGSLDLVGVGSSPAALAGSLAGTGSIRLLDARIPGLDPAAIARTAVMAERNTSQVDADAVAASLDAGLAQAPLPLGDTDGPAVLATGILRVGPLHAEGSGWTADADASLDLATLMLQTKVALKARQPLPDWKGGSPQVTVRFDGPLGETPSRSVDAASFVNALQARAIARDQERIDVMQQDVRERAYFNRRLKAIEADQQAQRERAKAEAEIEQQLKAEPPQPPAPAVLRPRTPAASEPAAGAGASSPMPPARPARGAHTRPLNIRPSVARPPPSSGLPPTAAVPDPTSAGRY